MINKKDILWSAKKMYTRISPTFFQTLEFLRSTEYKSEDYLKQLLLRQLKRMLINAYENSPYYEESFRRVGVNPHDFSKIEELEHFPFLTKNQYRDNIDTILTRKSKKSMLIRAYTGGTTGKPVPLYRHLNDFARERAFTHYAYQMLKMHPFCKTVYIRGHVDDKKGIYSKSSVFGKTLFLSSHNTTDTNLDLYIKLIRSFKPKLLYTLPSIAMVLTNYMKKNNIPHFPGLEWAFCPSENLYDYQIEFIQEVLKCRVGNFYGHSEHAVMATRCTHSKMFHVLSQYGYAELIDMDGNIIKEEGKLGEIIGTSFTNSSVPLIRYRTGDFAVFTNKKCQCGRNYQLWETIEGRGQDIAIGKNMEKITIGPDFLCTIHDDTYMKIKQFKIEQKNIGKLTFLVLPFNNDDLSDIQKYFKRVFNNQYSGCFDIEVQLYEESSLNQSDKHRFFFQHVKMD